jgi:hypothetical protein
MLFNDDILSQLVANCSCTPTPTNNTIILAMNLTPLRSNEGNKKEDASREVVSEIATDDSIPIPDWYNLELKEIFNNLNPTTKKGEQDQ